MELVCVVCDNRNIKAGTACEVVKRKTTLFGTKKVLCQPPYGDPQWYLERQVVVLPQ